MMKRGEKLPPAKKAELWVDLLIGDKTNVQLATKYKVSEVTITNNRRKVEKLVAKEDFHTIAKLNEILERGVLQDLMTIRDIVMNNLEIAQKDPDTYDLQKAVRDSIASADSRIRYLHRVTMFIDASTTTVNVQVVQAQAEQDVMARVLKEKGPDGKPLLSKQSRVRVLAHFAKPVKTEGGKKT